MTAAIHVSTGTIQSNQAGLVRQVVCLDMWYCWTGGLYAFIFNHVHWVHILRLPFEVIHLGDHFGRLGCIRLFHEYFKSIDLPLRSSCAHDVHFSTTGG
jgi:hypothetical protein